MAAAFNLDNPNALFIRTLPADLMQSAIRAEFIDEPIWTRTDALSVLNALRRLQYAPTHVYVYGREFAGPFVPAEAVYDRELDLGRIYASWPSIVNDSCDLASAFVTKLHLLRDIEPLFSFWAYDEHAYRGIQAAEADGS